MGQIGDPVRVIEVEPIHDIPGLPPLERPVEPVTAPVEVPEGEPVPA